MADVADCVDVIYGGFVVVGGDYLAVLGHFDAYLLQADLLGLGASADGEEDSVEGVFDLIVALLESYDLSAL